MSRIRPISSRRKNRHQNQQQQQQAATSGTTSIRRKVSARFLVLFFAISISFYQVYYYYSDIGIFFFLGGQQQRKRRLGGGGGGSLLFLLPSSSIVDDNNNNSTTTTTTQFHHHNHQHNNGGDDNDDADDDDDDFVVTAMIIEIRCNPALSLTLLSAEEFYPPYVKILVFHSLQNDRFVRGLLQVHPSLRQSRRIFLQQIIPQQWGSMEPKRGGGGGTIYYGDYWYQRIITNLTFWETFVTTRYAINMQSDTLLCRPFRLEEFASHNESYIGGVSGFKRHFLTKVPVTADPNPHTYIKYNHMNGGFSLRRVDWVKRCIQQYGNQHIPNKPWIEDDLSRHCQEMEINGTVYANEFQAYSLSSDNGQTLCFNNNNNAASPSNSTATTTTTTAGQQQRICPMATHKPWKLGTKIWGKDSYQELINYCPALIHHEKLCTMPMPIPSMISNSTTWCPAYDRSGNIIQTFDCGGDCNTL